MIKALFHQEQGLEFKSACVLDRALKKRPIRLKIGRQNYSQSRAQYGSDLLRDRD